MAQVTPLQPALGSATTAVPEAPRLRNDPLHLQRSFLAHVSYSRAKGWATATALDQAVSPQEWNMLFLCSPEFMY